MRIPRSHINKVVKLTWKDPLGARERQDISVAPKGQAALAKWEEYGVIDDITDGVVRMRHSVAYSPAEIEADEAFFSWVVEDLVTDVEILVPEKGVIVAN